MVGVVGMVDRAVGMVGVHHGVVVGAVGPLALLEYQPADAGAEAAARAGLGLALAPGRAILDALHPGMPAAEPALDLGAAAVGEPRGRIVLGEAQVLRWLLRHGVGLHHRRCLLLRQHRRPLLTALL